MRKILEVLDPFSGYNFKRDTSHLLAWSLSQRGHQIFYTDPPSLFSRSETPLSLACPVSVLREPPYFSFHPPQEILLSQFDLILMRKDPPVDPAYLYATQLLSLVEKEVWIINAPQALRDWNEKLSILHFPKWIPRTLVTADRRRIEEFTREVGGVSIVKRLDSFAAKGIAKVGLHDGDLEKVSEMTHGGKVPVLIQEYLPIERGEKRVFWIDGEARGAILRLPPSGGYLADPDRGGRITRTTLTDHEGDLCREVGDFLKTRGVFFAGIDLIDGRLTEINITSPGLLWEWNEVDGAHHEEEIVDLMERKLMCRGNS